jgi:nucleoside-diphosphate kinase
MIKPDQYQNFGKIVDAVQSSGFQLCQLKMSKFNQSTVGKFYGEHTEKPFYPTLSQFMTSDVCIGMELINMNGIQAWR